VIRCVVFDFDGTLVDSNALKRKAFFAIADQDARGRGTMEGALEVTVGDRRAILGEYVRRMSGFGRSLDLDELVAAYARIVDPLVVEARELPGARQLLDELRERGLATYLSSGTPAESLHSILDGRGWRRLFDGVFGHPATKEQTLALVLQTHMLTPDQLVSIGDGEDDARAAEVVGCTFLPVGSGSFLLNRPGSPTFSLEEVGARIRDLTRAESAV
jgi:phosphoglycolate phosphatase-like HAD superfamily hydrolase